MLRKLPRVLINVLTALSLMLCIGLAVLWVRSYRPAGDRVVLCHGGRLWQVASVGGAAGLDDSPERRRLAGEQYLDFRILAARRFGEIDRLREDDISAMMSLADARGAELVIRLRGGRPTGEATRRLAAECA